jgi:PAS domain S-box-containing protein
VNALRCVVRPTAGTPARAASTRKIQIAYSAEVTDPDPTLTRELLARTGCETLVAIPLVAHGNLVGVHVFGLPERHEFTSDEQAAFNTCAKIIAFGIRSAIIYEEEWRLHSLFEAVGNATVAISGEFELKSVLQNIVDEARNVTGAEYAALGIATSADRPFEPWVFSGLTKEQEEMIGRHPRPVGTLAIVAWQGRSIRVPDVQRLPAFRGFPLHHPRMTSLLGVPIRHRERPIGNLYLANKRGANEFSEEDERAIELLAAQAGSAVQQVTLRLEAETQRARFASIVENAPYAVLFIEAGTEKVIANRRAHVLAGEESVPTLASFQGQICTPDGKPLPRTSGWLAASCAAETFDTQELLVRRSDGHEVPVLASAAPVFNREGGVDGAVIVFEDISKLKDLQRLREEWVSIVTHDLRHPLNLIALNVGMLRELAAHPERDHQESQKRLDQTEETVGTLNRMISDLTDVSNIETAQLVVQLQSVRLDELVRDVVEQHRAAAPDRTITLKTIDTLSQIEADPLRIGQVLSNLLGNALKYSTPGTNVDVEVRPVANEVHVLITNRGPGIPAPDPQRSLIAIARPAREKAR